jgi:hypothetical protein
MLRRSSCTAGTGSRQYGTLWCFSTTRMIFAVCKKKAQKADELRAKVGVQNNVNIF